MALTEKQISEIKDLLRLKISGKLTKYARETTSMPFLVKLMQDSEKVAAYSFIHSLATTLGMSIYEEVSVIIASENSDECYRHYGVGGVISKDQKTIINDIVTKIRNREIEANIENEIEKVLKASRKNAEFQKSGDISDFFMIRDDIEHYFEIKTVKPNIEAFEKNKTKLLEWVARRRKKIKVFLAFPYNPYYPQPYSRFTEVGMMDHPNDFLIGEEYWDFIGGKNTFPELLKTFNDVGKEFKEQLSKKFKEIAKNKIDSKTLPPGS